MKPMKALLFERFGSPSVLCLRERSVPDLQPGQALVEVHASAINPSDVKNVAGVFKACLPRVPGRDYAGVVAAGEGWEGKEVWGSGAGFGVTRDGADAQYVVADLDSLSEKPARLSMAEASAIGVPYLGAWSALIDAAEIQSGETVLISGALGAVGRAAIQIAHWRKARVIGADRDDGASDADAFVNVKSNHLPAAVKVLTGGRGVDVVLDTVGGPLFELCLGSLRRGGRQVAIASVGDGRVDFDLVDFYHNSLRLIGVDTLKLTGPEIANIMNKLRAGFDDGQLRPSPVQTWGLEQGVEAYEAAEKGRTRSKQVLLPRHA